jgi:hypothetical protein
VSHLLSNERIDRTNQMTRPIENHQPRSRYGNAVLDDGSQVAAINESSRRITLRSTSRREQRRYLRNWMLIYETDRKDEESHGLSARQSILSSLGLDRELRFDPRDFRDGHPDLTPPLRSSLSTHPMRIRRRRMFVLSVKSTPLSNGVVDSEPSTKHDHRESGTDGLARLPSIRRAHEEDDGSDEKEDESNDDEGDDDAQEEESHDDAGKDGGSTSASEIDETTGTKSNNDESNKDIPVPMNDSHASSNQSKGVPTPPMNSDTTSGSHAKVSCGGTICQLGLLVSTHIIISSLAVVTLALLCYWRLRICCSRRRVDHGEYRMVTAQYVDSAFDDSLSDDEGSDDENFDGGWSKAGKRSIEMHAIDREMNGGLTLEEMNG